MFETPRRLETRDVDIMVEEEDGMVARCCWRAREGLVVFMLCDLECGRRWK